MMWSRLLFLGIFLIFQQHVFCQEYQPLLDYHGGTAALHISATNLSSNTQRCGAVLISDRHLLTAASCLKGKEYERVVSISLGREDLDVNSSPGSDSYEIEKATIHPDFVYGGPEYNDIAVLTTKRKVQYSTKVWPYCLPEINQTFTQFLPVQIAGWGYVNHTTKLPNLHVAYVKLMNKPRCYSEWHENGREHLENVILKSTYPQGLDNRLICAGRQGVDACIGDAGGPMTFQNQYGRHVLIGLIAKRDECPEEIITPGFYTNIAHYVDWIYEATEHYKEFLYHECGGQPQIVTTDPPKQPVHVVVDSEAHDSIDTEVGAGNGDDKDVVNDTVFGSGQVKVDIRSQHSG